MSNRSATNALSNQKQIPARKTKSNGFECWQINLHRSKAASYNLCEVTVVVVVSFISAPSK